jgi:hypothetical protein
MASSEGPFWKPKHKTRVPAPVRPDLRAVSRAARLSRPTTPAPPVSEDARTPRVLELRKWPKTASWNDGFRCARNHMEAETPSALTQADELSPRFTRRAGSGEVLLKMDGRQSHGRLSKRNQQSRRASASGGEAKATLCAVKQAEKLAHQKRSKNHQHPLLVANTVANFCNLRKPAKHLI